MNEGYHVYGGLLAADVYRMQTELLRCVDRAGSSARQSRGHVFAMRNVDEVCPASIEWATSPPLGSLIQALLGAGAGLVRAIYFDKPVGRGWALPWHQDRMIAVSAPGQGPVLHGWSRKSGQWHCEAPVDVLQGMVAARVHLDDASLENGALEVIPGSHEGEVDMSNGVPIEVAAGDVLLMRPLLWHRSGRPSAHNRRARRVLHFEYASDRPLPDGAEWARFYRIVGG